MTNLEISMGAEWFAFVLQVVGRLGLYLCVFLLVGLAVARSMILQPVLREFSLPTSESRDLQLSRVAVWTAGLLIVVCLVRVFAQTYAVFGVDEGITAEGLSIVVTQTPWGTGWGVQLLASAAVAIAASLAYKRARFAWYGMLLTTAMLVVSVPLTGHAMSQSVGKVIGVGIQVTHVMGGAVWIGSLWVILWLGLTAPTSAPAVKWEARVVERFSPIALAAVGGLLVAGVVSAFVFLDSWTQLTQTAYGRTLLGKVVFFAATGVVGAYNWRILRPKLGKSDNSRALRRSIGTELAVALIVLGVTAVMVALPLEH